MTLNIDKKAKYAEAYNTNWNYLHDLADLQMKALEEMKWKGRYGYNYIDTDLWSVPRAWYNKKTTKDSVEDFMELLNEKIRRL